MVLPQHLSFVDLNNFCHVVLLFIFTRSFGSFNLSASIDFNVSCVYQIQNTSFPPHVFQNVQILFLIVNVSLFFFHFPSCWLILPFYFLKNPLHRRENWLVFTDLEKQWHYISIQNNSSTISSLTLLAEAGIPACTSSVIEYFFLFF